MATISVEAQAFDQKKAECSNCNDGCLFTRYCKGCESFLCDLCYKEHNAIHITPKNSEHHCCCDECIEGSPQWLLNS